MFVCSIRDATPKDDTPAVFLLCDNEGVIEGWKTQQEALDYWEKAWHRTFTRNSPTRLSTLRKVG